MLTYAGSAWRSLPPSLHAGRSARLQNSKVRQLAGRGEWIGRKAWGPHGVINSTLRHLAIGQATDPRPGARVCRMLPAHGGLHWGAYGAGWDA